MKIRLSAHGAYHHQYHIVSMLSKLAGIGLTISEMISLFGQVLFLKNQVSYKNAV